MIEFIILSNSYIHICELRFENNVRRTTPISHPNNSRRLSEEIHQSVKQCSDVFIV